MLNNWTKETAMSNDEKYNLHEYRISQLEANHAALQHDIKDIKELTIKMDKRLSSIPEAGLQCGIHALKMDDVTHRLEVVEAKTEKINKKIVTWTAIASVIVFILTQIALPYLLNNVRITTNPPIKTTQNSVIQP